MEEQARCPVRGWIHHHLVSGNALARVAFLLVLCSSTLVLSGCGAGALSREVIFCDWAEDQVPEVLEAFQAETGIPVTYEPYSSQEQLIEEMKAGKRCDVLVMDNQLLPPMIQAGLLAKMDLSQIHNFDHLSHNFINKVFDPGNQYSVPYTWGTFGLIASGRTVQDSITKWADLWEPEYAGQIVMWTSVPRYTMGAALFSLGHPVNSEDPAQLQAAADRLIELKSRASWLDEAESIAPTMEGGDVLFGTGWAYDYWLVAEEDPYAYYILPQEGTILWGDSLLIGANVSNIKNAHQFIDFLLRPDIAAKISNQTYYASANVQAMNYVDMEIILNPVVYPQPEDLEKAQLLLPLSPQGQAFFDQAWQRFLDAPG